MKREKRRSRRANLTQVYPGCMPLFVNACAAQTRLRDCTGPRMGATGVKELESLFGPPTNRLFNGQERPSAARSLERQAITGNGAEEHHNQAAKQDRQDDSHGQNCTIAFGRRIIGIVEICPHGKWTDLEPLTQCTIAP